MTHIPIVKGEGDDPFAEDEIRQLAGERDLWKRRYMELNEAVGNDTNFLDKRPFDVLHASALKLARNTRSLLELAHERLITLGVEKGVLEPDPNARTPETTLAIKVRLLFEQKGAEVAKLLAANLPPGVGFMLFVFDFGEGGNLAWYMSNAERDGARKALAEWLLRTSGTRDPLQAKGTT